MINYETILSNFQDKVTLMQWLKKVEDALKNASLSSVTFTNTSNTSGYFTFTFADGSSVNSPSMTMPQGPQGPRGPQGPSGNSFRIIGSVSSVADLPSTAVAGDAFFVGVSAPRNVYVYDALTNSWINQGPLNATILLSELESYLQSGTNISVELNADETAIIINCILDTYTKTQIDEQEQNLREVAEGKSKSYVVNNLSDINGVIDANGNFTDVVSITGVTLLDLKVGDVILIKALDVADYWVSQVTPSISLNKLETSKVDLLNGIYPVGSIYMNVSNVNPATLFGGTWEQLKDRFLLGAGDTYSAGATGGEAQHTLTINEMPSHNHNFALIKTNVGTGGVQPDGRTIQKGYAGSPSEPEVSPIYQFDAQGGSQPHNNMPPYLVVYMWRRTA